MTSRIALERARLKASPVAVRPDQAGVDLGRLLGEIEGWKQSIRLWQQGIRSSAQRSAMIHAHNRFGPGAYSAGQSHRSQMQNLRKLHQATLRTAAELTGLIRDLVAGNPVADALEGIAHALSNLMDSGPVSDADLEAMGLGAQGQVITASIRQIDPASGADLRPGPGQGLDVFTLLLALFTLLKAVQQKRRT
ncbi:MAG: hypothetical protein WCZ72_11190 [Gemmobacter sp.]